MNGSFNKYNLMDEVWVVIDGSDFLDVTKDPLSRSVVAPRTVIGIMVGNMNIETRPIYPTLIQYSLLDENTFKYQIFPENQIYSSYEDAKIIADRIDNIIMNN